MLLSICILVDLFLVAATALSTVTRVPVRRNANYDADGSKSLIWLYNKYNITPAHPDPFYRDSNGMLKKRQDGAASTEVNADDQLNDTFYTCPIWIGTPGQQLAVTFDSGSADTWVWSSRLSPQTVALANSRGSAIYDLAKSTSYTNLTGSTWLARYGDGSSASGTVVTDVLQVGDITVENQAIEVANTLSYSFITQAASEGILGLAFSRLNKVQPVPQKTPLDNMIAQEDIPGSQALFTCYLGSYKDAGDPDQGISFFTFGEIDQDVVKATGKQISYTPVNDTKGFWQIDSEFITINGKKTALVDNTAIVDTGTTLVIIEDKLVAEIYSTIPGARFDAQEGGWVFPASTPADKMPTVVLAVGQTEVIIEKEHLGFTPVKKTGMVYGGIQGRGNSKCNIFGDTLLKCVYAVFDAGNMRFGVVQRVDETQNIAG
ncbi:Aspartic protease pep1 [Cladophialophora carrionii]|uniref:Aspartic protease pep1 n=1 Tax=Cladophialophora carrionii TaxID=86049 RepID=A0A1C1CWB2_9EURO|nr:Aspartic protease pep1 [Cladophialophora carrionii]